MLKGELYETFELKTFLSGSRQVLGTMIRCVKPDF